MSQSIAVALKLEINVLFGIPREVRDFHNLLGFFKSGFFEFLKEFASSIQFVLKLPYQTIF